MTLVIDMEEWQEFSGVISQGALRIKSKFEQEAMKPGEMQGTQRHEPELFDLSASKLTYGCAINPKLPQTEKPLMNTNGH